MRPYNQLCDYEYCPEHSYQKIEGRDYHFLLWIADSGYRTKHPADLNAMLDQDGIDINLQSLCRSHRGDTALMLAIKFYPALVTQILEKKPNLDIKNEFGETALIVAFHSPSIFERLVKDGANVNAQDTYGRTPLINAMRQENNENANAVLNILLEHPDCDLSIRDNDGNTALKLAIDKRDLSEAVFTSFLEKHATAHINAQDDDGNTVAMCGLRERGESSCRNGRVMQLIQRSDIDVSLKNKKGKRLLLFALRGSEKKEMILDLLKKMRDKQMTLSIEEQQALKYYAISLKNNESFLKEVLTEITDPQVLVAGVVSEMRHISSNAHILHGEYISVGCKDLTRKQIETHRRQIVTILQSGVDIRTKDGDGKSALMVAFSLFDIPWSVRGRLLWMTARNNPVNMGAAAVGLTLGLCFSFALSLSAWEVVISSFAPLTLTCLSSFVKSWWFGNAISEVLVPTQVASDSAVVSQQKKNTDTKGEFYLGSLYPNDNAAELLKKLGCEIVPFSSWGKGYILTYDKNNTDFQITSGDGSSLDTSQLLFMGVCIASRRVKNAIYEYYEQNTIYEAELPDLIIKNNKKKFDTFQLINHRLRCEDVKTGVITSKPIMQLIFHYTMKQGTSKFDTAAVTTPSIASGT